MIDQTGLGHDATVFEDASYSTQGLPGGSFEFDGDGDYIQTPDAPDLRIIGDVTIAAWIKGDSFAIDDVSPYGNHNIVLAKDLGTHASEYEIAVYQSRIHFFRGNHPFFKIIIHFFKKIVQKNLFFRENS